MNFIKCNSKGKKVLRANYCPDVKSGSFSDSVLYSLDNNATAALMWDKKQLALELSSADAEEFRVAAEGYSASVKAESGRAKLFISAEEAGLAFSDIYQFIPLTVTAVTPDGERSEECLAKLCDYDKLFLVDAAVAASLCEDVVLHDPLDPDADFRDVEFGMSAEGNSLHIYDIYSETGKNRPYISSTVCAKPIETLAKKEGDVYIEATVEINAFPGMDYQNICNIEDSYGLDFVLNTGEPAASLFFGIQRFTNGKFFVFLSNASGAFGQTKSVVPIRIGESFRFGARWNENGRIILYIDDLPVSSFSDNRPDRKSYPPKSLTIKWSRSRHNALSHADDFDATVSNIFVLREKGTPAATDLPASALYGGKDTSPLLGTAFYPVTESLTLPDRIDNQTYGIFTPLVWESSDESLLCSDGTLSAAPHRSGMVTMTVRGVHGRYIAFEKQFKLFVMSAPAPSEKALAKLNDRDPFTGSAERYDGALELFASFNSVVYDMGETARVNRVTLRTAGDSVGICRRNYISLYVSDDNQSYTYVKDFSLLRGEKELYIYNFDVKARYVKVHTTTNGLGNTGSVINTPDKMITAEYTDALLLSEGSFAKERTISFKNDTDKRVFDKIFDFTLSELGIDESELGSLRITAGGKQLPLYYYGGKVSVRVFSLEAGETLEGRVFFGDPSARPVFDGNEVFEIEYGTKHARYKYNNEYGWFNSVARMPNGDLLRIVNLSENFPEAGHTALAMYRSKDGGLTWSDYEIIPGTAIIKEGGGFLVDEKRGKVFYFAYDFDINENEKYCRYHIFESDDNGYTWTGSKQPVGNKLPAPDWAISYSDGITLSTADGEGPEVDYVFTTGMCRDLSTDAFCTTAIYSRDGGKSWIFSDSRVTYDVGDSNFHEGGLSEETVIEQPDGTLVFYARCQIEDIWHFAVSRSYDHGVSWEKATLSNIYTTNTQPIIAMLRETPVFLWGGNNALGGRSYKRYPLNLAYSEDEGNSFKGIIDASFATAVATFNGGVGLGIHTNPDLAFTTYGGLDVAYIVSTRHQLYIQNFEDYLYKTKGAYDSFEHGTSADGWCNVDHTEVKTTEKGATDGKLALLCERADIVVRSLHSIEKGEVSFDLSLPEGNYGFAMELQTAFADTVGRAAPISVYADKDGAVFYYAESGKKSPASTGLVLSEGINSLSFAFDGQKREASLTLNGKTAPIAFADNGNGDDYISFFTIFAENTPEITLDRFIAVKE